MPSGHGRAEKAARDTPPCPGAAMTNSLLTCGHSPTIVRRRGHTVRQFIYGMIIGAGFMYAYERLDPPSILAYLNSATASAVRSTSGYGGKDARH